MLISKIFNSKDKDDEIVLQTSFGGVTFGELKAFITFKCEEFLKSPCEKVVLLGADAFEFAINFWAGIFANKEIYVLSDEKRLNFLNFKYILPTKITQKAEIVADFTEPIDTKIVIFTSGSSGKPKSIVKDLGVILTEGEAIAKEFQALFKPNSTIYTTSNYSHMFVLTMFLILPLLKNFVIDTRKIEYPEQLDNVGNPAILITSPSFLESLEKYETNLNNPPYLIFSAGSELKNETQYYFEKQNSTLINIYGATEAGVIGYKTKSTENSLQKFAPIEIIKENSLLKVKSPFCLEEEILTSDLVEIFENEKFIVKGRSDRLVKILDKRVSLIEIENDLKKHEWIEDCYCLSYGGKLCSAVVLTNTGCRYALKNGTFALKNKLKKFLREFSEIVPTRFKFIFSIPKDERGKINTDALKEIFGTNISQPIVLSAQNSEDTSTLELFFPKSSNFLKGHFSILPIVPGVVQLQFAQKFANEHFKLDLPIWQVKRIKFSGVISPDKIVRLKLKNSESAVLFEYLNENDETYSSGSFAKIKGATK